MTLLPASFRRPVNVFPALPLLLAAQALSVLGSAAYSVSVLWYVKTTYGADALVALLTTIGAVVSVLLSLPAGRTADTWDRRWLLLKADFACCLALLLLLLALWTGAAHLYPVLLGVSVIISMASVQAEPALLASFPHLTKISVDSSALLESTERTRVETNTVLRRWNWRRVFFPKPMQSEQNGMTNKAGLGRVNALHQLLNSGAGIFGAVLGGLLAAVSLDGAVLVNLASFLLSFLLVALAKWPKEARGMASEPQQAAPKLRAAAFLRAHPFVGQLVVLVSVFLLLAAPLPALLPALAHDHLHAGAQGLGTLEAALGAGFVLGGLLAMSGVRPRNLRELCLPVLIAGAVRLGLGQTEHLWLIAALLVLNGAAIATAGIAAMTLLQEQLPEGERGAALGLTFSLTDGARPLGLALATVLLPTLHMAGVLHWSGVGLLVLGVAGWMVKHRA